MHATNQNNDIIIKERYGSSTREITYTKSLKTNCISIKDTKNKTFLLNKWLASILLPKGYPYSVSKDYIAYQIWDTCQAFCSTITGILATQEVLRGVGVGSQSATPLAATITWIIKDGCGHIGRIAFASTQGTNLDSYSKKWRLYADILNDAAMCLELGLSFMGNFTTLVLCCSTVMRAIVGVAGGATRAAMTQHHANRGNLADVSAKDSTQETIVNLIASLTALFLITTFKDYFLLNILFFLLIFLHIVFNFKAVKATCIQVFNEPRLLLSIEMVNKRYPTPESVNDCEPIIFHNNFMKRMLNGFQIKMGCSIQEIIKEKNIENLISMKNIYHNRNYILIADMNKKMIYIVLKEKVTVNEILCSYFHSALLISCAFMVDQAKVDFYKNLENNIITIRKESNSREPNEITNDDHLLLNTIITKNWQVLSDGLTTAGWDLNKHLLIVDEWRIGSLDNTNERDVKENKKDL